MQNQLFEKIELYLHHELEGEELRLFEEQLKNDTGLREQLALYKIIDDEMRHATSDAEEKEKLRDTLSDLNKKYFAQPDTSAKVIGITRSYRWVVAAAILLLIAGAYWYFVTGNKESEKLYAQYAIHQPLSLQRGDNDTAKLLQDAITAYNNKKFKAALNNFDLYLQKDSSDAELVLAKNICLIENGNYEQAIEGLERLSVKNVIFKYQAVWYKALAYLKQNNKPACKETLQAIPPGADTYSNAKRLLEDL